MLTLGQLDTWLTSEIKLISIPTWSSQDHLKKHIYLTPKPVNFNKEPDTPINNDQNKKLQDINNLIPDIGDIDALALRRSLHIRTQLDKTIENERQTQTRQSNSIIGSFKNS